MTFTEEQIAFIMDCIYNAQVELYNSEYAAIEDELRKFEGG